MIADRSVGAGRDTRPVISPPQFIEALNQKCGDIMGQRLRECFPGSQLTYTVGLPEGDGAGFVIVHHPHHRVGDNGPQWASVVRREERVWHVDDPALGPALWRDTDGWEMVLFARSVETVGADGLPYTAMAISSDVVLAAYRELFALGARTPARICHLEDLLPQQAAACFEEIITADHDNYNLPRTDLLHRYSYCYISGLIREYVRYVEDAIAHCYKDPTFVRAMAEHIVAEKCAGVAVV